jgi:ferrochelatase
VLLSTGCPSGREDVGRFIGSILSDPDVITLPVLRPLLFLFGPLIGMLRRRKVTRRYELIGGFTRLAEGTARIAAAVEKRLGVEVRPAYRYSRPGFAEVLAGLRAGGVDRVAAIPLNPHYSISTNGSFLSHLLGLLGPLGMSASALPSFYGSDDYLDLMVEHIRGFVSSRGGDGGMAGVHYLFTAHSVPVRNLSMHDPYVAQVQATAAALEERLGAAGRTSLAFQSSAGPMQWVGPDAADKVGDLGRQGVDALFVVPLSFVVENLETLFDLDMDLKETARRSNVRHYHRVPVLGEHEEFPEVLGRMAGRLL